MKITTKVLHIENKVSKTGSKYQLVHVLLTIAGQEFVRKFAIFGQ